MYKGPYADLIFNQEENFIAPDDELMAHVEILKQNVQSCLIAGFEKPTPAQNKERHRTLCTALDSLYQTNIGRQILMQLTQNVTLVSLTAASDGPFAGVHGISWGYLELANIAPDTLFKRPYYETMEAVAHELMHIAHYCLEQDVLAEVRQANGCDLTDELPQAGESPHLNAYDLFTLRFLNEAGAYLTGQRVGYCFMPDIIENIQKTKRMAFSLRPLMRDDIYWRENYQEALERISQSADPDQELKTCHTKVFYKIQSAYFELHPELKNAHLTRHIHKGFKMLSDVVLEDRRAHEKEKVTPKQFVSIYAPIVPYLVATAQKLKV